MGVRFPPWAPTLLPDRSTVRIPDSDSVGCWCESSSGSQHIMPMPTIELQREWQRKWVAKRRADWFSDKVCCVCGSKARLELHHRDPTTKSSHKIWSWSLERRASELLKCEVRCASCHDDVHRPEPIHNDARYKNGCRCEICREAHKLGARKYRNGAVVIVAIPVGCNPTTQEVKHPRFES